MDINLGLSALATGTVDAITATYSPAPTLVDKKILFLRTIGTNTITNPTFSPNGLTAHTITKNNGSPLVAGDMNGVVCLMYDLPNTRWELITPKGITIHTLAQILGAGNKTGETAITSNDLLSNLQIFDGGIFKWTSDGGVDGESFIKGSTGGALLGNQTSGLSVNGGFPLSWVDYIDILSGLTNIVNSGQIDLSAPSVTKNGSEIATQSYVDGLVVGLLDDRGSFDASVNLFPSSGGSGTAGAILKGDIWYISVAGTLGGVPVTIGDSVRALVDTPAQTATNWSVLETNIGYVPENVANKENSTIDANATKYPTVNLLNIGLLTKISHSLATAANDFLVASGAGTFVKKTLAETKTILGLAFGTLAGTYAEGNDSRLSDARNQKMVAYKSEDSTHTGNTSETILCNLAIPAGSMGANDVFRYMSNMFATGVTGGKTFKAYLSPNNNSLTGAVQVGQTGGISTTVYFTLKKKIANKNSVSTNYVFLPATNSFTDEVTSSATARSATNIDFSVNQWFIITVTLASSLDTGGVADVQVYIDRA